LNQLTFSRHFYEATSIHRGRPFDLQLCVSNLPRAGRDWTVGSNTLPFLIEELNHPTTATFPKTLSGYQLVLIVLRNFLFVATITRQLLYRIRLIKVEHNSFCSLAWIEHTFFLYPTRLIRIEHNSLFAVWLGSSTTSFLYPARLIRIEHNSLFAVWLVLSTASFLQPTPLIRIEHNSLPPTGVTPCSLARPSVVQTSEHHKTWREHRFWKLCRAGRVNEQHDVRIVCHLSPRTLCLHYNITLLFYVFLWFFQNLLNSLFTTSYRQIKQ